MESKMSNQHCFVDVLQAYLDTNLHFLAGRYIVKYHDIDKVMVWYQLGTLPVDVDSMVIWTYYEALDQANALITREKKDNCIATIVVQGITDKPLTFANLRVGDYFVTNHHTDLRSATLHQKTGRSKCVELERGYQQFSIDSRMKVTRCVFKSTLM